MTKGSKTRNPQKPAMTIRDGALKATLWRREGESGPFYSVSFSRSYKKAEGEYADSTSFSGAELLRPFGVVDQFFGDTLLIMFGAAEASKPEEQGISAIRAAFAIRDRARAMAAHWHRYGLPRELDVRVGIDTGLGAVGVIGSELTRRFTVLGPVSHTAAYLHTLPSESGVLASLAAFAKFRRAVKAKLRGTQPVAALHRNLEIYEIEGLVDDD